MFKFPEKYVVKVTPVVKLAIVLYCFISIVLGVAAIAGFAMILVTGQIYTPLTSLIDTGFAVIAMLTIVVNHYTERG